MYCPFRCFATPRRGGTIPLRGMVCVLLLRNPSPEPFEDHASHDGSSSGTFVGNIHCMFDQTVRHGPSALERHSVRITVCHSLPHHNIFRVI